MSVLWFAFGIYIVGVALTLFIRPALMFHAENGTWKEFGLGRSGYATLFPFWMFTLVWAFVSYALATLGAVFFGAAALRSMPPHPLQHNIAAPISSMPIPTLPTTVMNDAPASAVVGKPPGYYVLETAKSGLPQYVYYGTSPPTLENVARLAHSG